eukprot:364691-Chlamydomonas_euryale.AAC.1
MRRREGPGNSRPAAQGRGLHNAWCGMGTRVNGGPLGEVKAQAIVGLPPEALRMCRIEQKVWKRTR